MSGVVALLGRHGQPIERAAVECMLNAALYRGLDGMRVYSRGAVALGHACMLVTPDDQIGQPLISARTGCVMSADVRLDNRSDILARLPGSPSQSMSDAEILLRSYEEWGESCLPTFLGDFAFVLWDPRTEEFICARDTSGQRTLYFRLDSSCFAAASEIHQLLQDPSIPVRAHENRIRQRLTPLNMFRNEKDSFETYFDGINSVPAGHVLSVDANEHRLRCFWTFEAPSEIRYPNEEDYAEHYRHLLSEVIRTRLRCAGPIGMLLSGGLDSASIAGTAHYLYSAGLAENRGFTSFSTVYPGLPCDESSYVQEMAHRYGFSARCIYFEDKAGHLPLESQGFLDSPNFASQDVRDAICKEATQSGIRVVLSGEIADNCVAGSRLVFDSLLRKGKVREFGQQITRHLTATGEQWHSLLLYACIGPLLPAPAQRTLHMAAMRNDYRRHGHMWLPPWMSQNFREELSRRHTEESLEIERRRIFANPTRHLEANLLYPPEVARYPAPWPLEIWRPFADRRLHEFLLAIPPEVKFSPHPNSDEFYAGSKRLVRRAMRGIIPESILERTSKTVFEAHFRREVAARWEMYASIFGPSASPEIARRGYVDPARFWQRVVELRNGTYGADLSYVLQMVGLETWLRALHQPRPQLVTTRSTEISSELNGHLHQKRDALARFR